MSEAPNPLSVLAQRADQEVEKLNVIDEQMLGWLAVYVEFLSEPVKGLKLRFFEDDSTPVVKQGPLATQSEFETNDQGIYVYGKVTIGRYLCQVEDQKRYARITTVEDREKPFWIVLPVGRPYFDIAVDPRFDSFRNSA
jgi:hypothetical protein